MKGISRRVETSRKVVLCGENAIEINGQILTPNIVRAYVESYQSHAFPVVTLYGTAIHPQVVANSYQSMLHGVFDQGHMIVAYDPEKNKRDRVLGSVIGVEFPPTPEGGWKVQPDKSAAPCIRAVSVVHRQLEQAEEILDYQQRSNRLTVSMEHKYNLDDSGFLVQGTNGLANWAPRGNRSCTPRDLVDMGYTYVPYAEAPEDLLACYDEDAARIIDDFEEQKVVCLLGGLNGTILYMGIGLTPIGKEKEAFISQLLASGISYVDVDGDLTPEVMAPLQRMVNLFRNPK